MRAFVFWLSIATVALPCGVSAENRIEDFAKRPDVLKARLSPKGDYLAVLRIVDDKRVVAVLAFPTLELSSVMSFPGNNQVHDFRWVNDTRIVGSVTRDFGRFEFLLPSGELFGMNADGSRSKHLFGIRAGDTRGPSATRQAQRNTAASASILHLLPDDPEHILVEIRNWTFGLSVPVEAARLNVYNGRVSSRIRAPTTGAQFLTDGSGEIRYAFSTDDDFDNVIHERDPETSEWRLFSLTEYGDTQVEPVAIDTDGTVFVRAAPDDGPLGVYEMHPRTQKLSLVYRHEFADARVLRGPDGEVWGAFVEADYPAIVPIKHDHRFNALLEQVKPLFPNRSVTIFNETEDRRLTLVGVRAANATTEVYIHDREAQALRKLFDNMPWIDDATLASVEAVNFTTRDGTLLRGYLTMPPDSTVGTLGPLVLMPHGGPHGIRDTWQFDSDAQLLAANGYAVLQVNYRGSGGYGMRFERMGFGEWAEKMQDDLTDAVKWAVAEKVADPERVCIYGWSYGGFAAMMSVLKEPGLYACAVPAAGVYDMDIQYRRADFARFTRWGKKYMDRVIGPTADDRRRASPIAHLERLETPLFLVHGEEDARVPVAHARELRKALEKSSVEVNYMEKANEGHGFFKEENRVDFYRALLAFLDRHIGSKKATGPG